MFLMTIIRNNFLILLLRVSWGAPSLTLLNSELRTHVYILGDSSNNTEGINSG